MPPEDSELNLPFDRLLFKFIGSMEHVPDKLESFSKDLQELELSVNNKDHEIDTLDTEVRKLRQKFDSLEKEIKEFKAKTEREIKGLEGANKGTVDQLGTVAGSLGKRLRALESVGEEKKKTMIGLLKWCGAKTAYVLTALLLVWATLKIRGG